MPLLPSLAGALLALLFDGPFNYEFSRQTDEKGEAHLILVANENLPAMEVTIVGDRQKIKRQLPPLKAGSKHKILWMQNSPNAAYDVKIVAGSAEADVSFEVARATGRAANGEVGKITALSSAEDLVFKRQAIYSTSFDVVGYKFEVYNTDGDVFHTDNGSAGQFKAGERITLKWDRGDDVFLVKAHFEGAQGQFADHILAPMAIEIPHTEIVFDSGKAIIKGEQTPMLDEAAAVAMNKLLAVENAKAAVGNALDGDAYIPKLFISGYTDTVGKPGENQKLSEQRAKAIAEYFHSKGVWSEIYFTGMGEKGLKVQTGDSVDEEKNRRALYVISFQPPTGAVFPSAGAWKRSANARARPKEIPPYPPKWREYEENKRNARSGGSSGSGGGGSDSGSDSGSGSGSGSGDTTGSTDRTDDADGVSSSRRAGLGEGGGSSEPYFGSAEGPPAVEGEPGATKKGCSVQPTELPGALVVLLAGMLGLPRRRR
jgi:outer membrane protein OmpA-like peptidoglycan-associated protein